MAGRIKEALAAPLSVPWLRPKRAQQKRWEALEPDELRTFGAVLVLCRRLEGLRRRIAPLVAQRCPNGSNGTSIVEAINCALRHRYGVPVRKSCSLSKSLEVHQARIKS